jgi:UDP-MurNAc hydroxylase
MKITKLGSATVIIETKSSKILCDPWLTDGAYYGSWCNYPPINLAKCDLEGIDYIYISHIHPDHFDPKTMALLDPSTPVLIHKYHLNFLKQNIERLGFTVLPIENGIPFPIGNNEQITIYAADNCDPTICGHMFGCITKDIKGSMQLDSLCVIEDGEYTLVNTNDCPFEIARQALMEVKRKYNVIDFALVGYTSASLYPHCMMEYTEAEMVLGKERAINRGLTTALKTLEVLQPRFYMPFAGTYILGGYNYEKNSNLPILEIQDAVAYLQSELDAPTECLTPILLNYLQNFDLSSESQSQDYIPICPEDRKEYILTVAKNFKYNFEEDENPTNEQLFELLMKSMTRFKKKQLEVGLFEDINLVFDLADNFYVVINLQNALPKMTSDIKYIRNFYRFKIDPRLLKRALTGPHLANWNNIEIGAHLGFSRNPDVFKPGVHTLINAMHV